MGRERRVDQKKKIRRTGRKWKREGWRHTKKHRKHGGEEERKRGREGYRSRDNEVGHQRGIRGREEGRQRVKCTPPLLLGLYHMGHLLCGSGKKASCGWDTGRPPGRGSYIPGPPTSSTWPGLVGVWDSSPGDS